MTTSATPPMPAIVGVIVAVLGAICQSLGVITPDWLGSSTFNLGLWKYCLDNECDDVPDAMVTTSLQVTRGCGIVGFAAIVTCSALGATLFCVKKTKRVTLLAAIAALLAAIFIVVEMAVFAADTPLSGAGDLGFSFHVTVGACVLCVLAAVGFLAAKYLTRRHGGRGAAGKGGPARGAKKGAAAAKGKKADKKTSKKDKKADKEDKKDDKDDKKIDKDDKKASQDDTKADKDAKKADKKASDDEKKADRKASEDKKKADKKASDDKKKGDKKASKDKKDKTASKDDKWAEKTASKDDNNADSKDDKRAAQDGKQASNDDKWAEKKTSEDDKNAASNGDTWVAKDDKKASNDDTWASIKDDNKASNDDKWAANDDRKPASSDGRRINPRGRQASAGMAASPDGMKTAEDGYVFRHTAGQQ